MHFLGVGTPQKKGEYGADLRHVHAVIDTLVPRLRRSAVIVGKSTVPVGTAAELVERARELAPAGVDVEVAWNPEFLREGFAVHDTLHPDRIVLGVQRDSLRAEAAMRELYAPLLDEDVPFLVTDLQTAELVKVSANAFLATKISFINAISEVCEAVDADVTLLADALGYDPRIGRRFLNAGLGFGGGCLPKDIRAFMARAGELGANHALTFLREVDSINMRRRTRMVELATKACGGSLLGANIAVLGAAFKPESDDVRDSPALNVAGLLQLNGATVNVYDPKAMENSRRVFPDAELLDLGDRRVRPRRRGAGAHRVAGVRRPRPRRAGRHRARQSRCRRPQLPGRRQVADGGLAGLRAGPQLPELSGPSRRNVGHDGLRPEYPRPYSRRSVDEAARSWSPGIAVARSKGWHLDGYCNDPRWPTCTPTVRTGPRRTFGKCSTGWTICDRCLSSNHDAAERLHWFALHGVIRGLASFGAKRGEMQGRLIADPTVRADPGFRRRTPGKGTVWSGAARRG